jgi:hypothetical protein
MAMVVSMKDGNTDGQAALKLVSDISLTSPADIALVAGNPDIAEFKKVGSDLNLVMENGETLDIENFFTIGPEGDFSRLQIASGETVATGLMVPEPDPGDRADDGGGLELSSLAGTGLMLGGGFSFFSMDDADPDTGSEIAKTQAMGLHEEATFAKEVTAMIGPETNKLSAEDYETALSSEDPARESDALSSDQGGTTVADAGQADVKPQADTAQIAAQETSIASEDSADSGGYSPGAPLDQGILMRGTASSPNYLDIEGATADLLSDLMPETS